MKFLSAQDDALKKGVSRLRTLRSGSVDAATVLAKGTHVPKAPSDFGSLASDATTGPSSYVAPVAGADCEIALTTKVVEDISAFAKMIWKPLNSTRTSVS